MSQDAMFFVTTGLIMIALVLIGPVFVVWRYQRGGTPPITRLTIVTTPPFARGGKN